MRVYTPRGLRIDFPPDYCFALMARLFPTVDAFQVLKTTEAVMSLTAATTFVTALVCFALRATPSITFISVAAAHWLVHLLWISGFNIPRFLIWLGLMHSYPSGFGLLFVVVVVAGYLLGGWHAVVAYLAGRAVGWSLSAITSWANRRRIKRAARLDVHAGNISQAELSFLAAYLSHARRIGKPLDLDITENELEEANWKPCLDHLAREWPELVSRMLAS